MFDRFDDRTLEIATVVVVVVIALVILCYLSIYLNPQVFFNPFKPPVAVATEAAFATPIATWTWTPTPTATNTHTPTATWTPTPTPTNTPRPPSPPKPKPPAPTATPWPYDYRDAGGRANCSVTGVYGWVLQANGLPEVNVQMRVGNDQGWRTDVWTDVNGFYRCDFGGGAIAGKWFVRVFKGGEARSMQFWWQTSPGCDSPYSIQEVEISWQHR
jgi:hypothetical protein